MKKRANQSLKTTREARIEICKIALKMVLVT